jgi:hypothetical protein
MKDGREYRYLESQAYDRFGHTVYQRLGNGTRLIRQNHYIFIKGNDMKAKHFISIVIIFAVMIYSFIFFVNGTAKRKVKEMIFKGVITKIYNHWNHNLYTFTICTEKSEDIDVTIEHWPYSWEYASIGDSIIKPPNTLMIIIKKPDGNSKEFFYR